MSSILKPGQNNPELITKPSFWQRYGLITIAVVLLIIAGMIWLYNYLQTQKMTQQYLDRANNINLNISHNLTNNTNNMNDDSQVTKPISQSLQIEVLQAGSGELTTKNGDSISVHYTGTLLDGTKFDSSLDRGQPITFTLGAGQVIAGWEQGLLDMKIGEKRQLTIPADLGYGSQSMGPIPANATLVFETELMAIN